MIGKTLSHYEITSQAVETSGKMPAAQSPRKINVGLNWLEELKQKAPAD